MNKNGKNSVVKTVDVVWLTHGMQGINIERVIGYILEGSPAFLGLLTDNIVFKIILNKLR